MRLSIISILDEEIVRQGSDSNLVRKLHSTHGTQTPHDHYIMPQMSSDMCFSIRHYAGDVVYTVEGWLDKNVDTLNPDLNKLMVCSSQRFLRELFENSNAVDTVPTTNSSSTNSPQLARVGSQSRGLSRRASVIRAPTVINQFKSQLSSLMDTLRACHPHYIR